MSYLKLLENIETRMVTFRSSFHVSQLRDVTTNGISMFCSGIFWNIVSHFVDDHF